MLSHLASAVATIVALAVGAEVTPPVADAPGAAAYTGEVAVIDIGVPRRILEPFLAARA